MNMTWSDSYIDKPQHHIRPSHPYSPHPPLTPLHTTPTHHTLTHHTHPLHPYSPHTPLTPLPTTTHTHPHLPHLPLTPLLTTPSPTHHTHPSHLYPPHLLPTLLPTLTCGLSFVWESVPFLTLDLFHCNVSLFKFHIKIANKNCKNMNSVQQQWEHHHYKVLIQSFHSSGHTFRFCWTVQDLEVFLV